MLPRSHGGLYELTWYPSDRKEFQTMDMLWRIDYRSGTYDIVGAATADEARAAGHAPAAIIDSVQAVTASKALADDYGHDWEDILDPVLTSESPEPGQRDEHDWLVLRFATAVDDEGRIDSVGLANFRTLRAHWAGIDSVRFDGGRVAVRALGAAPADLVEFVTNAVDLSGPIDHHMYAAVRAELGFTEDRTTRVAVHDPAAPDTWRIIDCPVTVLGQYMNEYNAIAERVPGYQRGPVIVVDAIPGFPAGCSTWSGLTDGPRLRQAVRREHWDCQHQLFGPAH